jgi:hypothetical protein
MEFLVGKKLDEAIIKICRSQRLYIAVAFWGKGAEKTIGRIGKRDVKIICNLASGGTNPDIIEALSNEWPNRHIKQNDRLHAKVWIGDDEIVITSANASTNGLGLEGREAHWIEAGVRMKERQDIIEWFNAQWKQSRQITLPQIELAKQLRSIKNWFRPTVDFINYEGKFPLITWWTGGEYTYQKGHIEKQIGYWSKELEDRLDDSPDIENPAEEPHYAPGSWFIFFDLDKMGNLETRPPKLHWIQIERILRKTHSYDGKKFLDAALVVEKNRLPPPPFDITSVKFREEFASLIRSRKYKPTLLDAFYYKKGYWLQKSRVELMRNFWNDLSKKMNQEFED